MTQCTAARGDVHDQRAVGVGAVTIRRIWIIVEYLFGVFTITGLILEQPDVINLRRRFLEIAFLCVIAKPLHCLFRPHTHARRRFIADHYKRRLNHKAESLW